MYRYRFSYVRTAKPGVLLSFRAGLTRDPHRDSLVLPGANSAAAQAACAAGLTGTLGCRTPYVTIENLSAFGESGQNAGIHSQKTPFALDLVWSKGKHLYAYGLDYVTAPFVYSNSGSEWGNFSFSHLETALPGVASTGAGIASYMIGATDSALVSSPHDGRWATSEVALYAQDKWLVTKKMTVNYGLRWELTIPSHELQNKISSFDPSEPNPGAGNILGALSIYGTGPGRNGLTQIGNSHFKAFAPKLGFAYAYNAKTVFRGNVGISYYAYWPKWVGSNGAMTRADGFSLTRSVSSLNSGITPVFYWQNGFPLTFPTFPVVSPTLDNGGGITYLEANDNRPPLVENLGAEIERELPSHIGLRVAYVGTMAHRLYASYNMDALPLKYLSLGGLLNDSITSAAAVTAGIPVPYPGFTGPVAQALTPYTQYTSVTNMSAQMGNSSYNSLQINVQRHFGDLTFLAAFAFAKYLTDSDEPGYNAAAAFLKVQSPYLAQTAKSLAGYESSNVGQAGDIARQLKLSWYWDMPVGRGKHFFHDTSKPLDYLLGNWRLSALQYYQGGEPLDLSSNESIPSLGSNIGVSPVLNQGVPIKAVGGCGDVQPNVSGKSAYLNRAAFSDAAPFTLGNTYVVPTVRGCGYIDEDVGLDEGFPIGEGRRVSVGAYFTNLFNRHQFQGLNGDIDSAAFGTFSSTNFPRVVQLYMKVTF